MATDDLSRMGASRVVRVRDKTGRLRIEKAPVSEVEYCFYQHVAGELNQAGIATPALISADAARRALILEYIPHPVSQADVTADDILLMLGQLHRFPARAEWVFHQHQWSESALEKTLALLSLSQQSAQQLRRFQRCSEVLFFPKRLISGDTNAGNWGKRANGGYVLFDWERFGQGSPAIDLAPLIKGMGRQQEFEALAARYQRFSSDKEKHLAREIAIAKAWIVSEVVTLLEERQKSDLSRYLSWYREHLPAWLNKTGSML
ncbi:aminoglycoside phosphotransferase family protein [Yokenella regensburgei]|uniref:phosphotransferase family protein n=1 Tax=Yokenella regensburgei TaxID=158877 RepID=UPI003F164E6C